MLSTDYTNIPSAIRAALDQYSEHHLPPGGFLSAVLANDLLGALTRADNSTRAVVWEIVSYCYWEIPSGSWGSAEQVRSWLTKDED